MKNYSKTGRIASTVTSPVASDRKTGFKKNDETRSKSLARPRKLSKLVYPRAHPLHENSPDIIK